MLDKQVIAYLRLVHGTYNLLIFLLFWYQAFLGFTIRKARKAGGSKSKGGKAAQENGSRPCRPGNCRICRRCGAWLR